MLVVLCGDHGLVGALCSCVVFGAPAVVGLDATNGDDISGLLLQCIGQQKFQLTNLKYMSQEPLGGIRCPVNPTLLPDTSMPLRSSRCPTFNDMSGQQ